MLVNLHANARTTPATRAYIQGSDKSAAALALELGVSAPTVHKWRKAGRVLDGSHCRRDLGQSTSKLHEEIVAELRTELRLSLDDVLEVMNRSDLGRKFSRSALHRCLVRLGLNRLPAQRPARVVGKFEDAPCGFIHIDLKVLTCLGGRRSNVFVAIDRATRFVFVRVIQRRDQHSVCACLKAFLAEFKHPVHVILTDNDGGFTDRFATHKKNKQPRRPSGRHSFDVLCQEHGIQHRLIRPFTPQTNGMVERFNRRLTEAIEARPANGANAGKNKFANHAERDAFIHRFAANYNRTRLKCLNYKAPIEALNNLTGQYTVAGVVAEGEG